VQLEPLQEGAEKMLNVIDVAKGKIGKISMDSGDGIFSKGLYHFVDYGFYGRKEHTGKISR
jgi:hypothetical protein